VSSPNEALGENGIYALAAELLDRDLRAEAARKLAKNFGCEHAIFLVRDERVGVLLPALGFPQTFPSGRRWRQFLDACSSLQCFFDKLPYPDAATEWQASGFTFANRGALVLLGTTKFTGRISEIAGIVRLVCPYFSLERELHDALSRAESAERTASQTAKLTAILDRARDRAQLAHEEAQRLSEALRQESQERFYLVARATSDIIWEWDLATNRIWWSEGLKNILGYDESERKAGASWRLELIQPQDRRRVSAGLRKAIAEGAQKWSDEYRIRRADGVYVDVLDKAYIQRDNNGATRVIGAIVDISERKRLEERLRQAHKLEALGRLAGGVAHDFNNLLTVIDGYASSLLETMEEESPYRNDIYEIRNAAECAAALTRQLLAYARQQVLQPEVLDLNELVTRSTEMLQRLIGSHIVVDVRTYGGGAYARVDRTQVEQVLLNLAANARDAMPQGGRLTIEVDEAVIELSPVSAAPRLAAGKYVRLSVADSGNGIDERELPLIFDPFFTTKPKGKGTGLGLATVFGIVQQSGGAVEVQSWPGEGTRFTVYFPAGERQAEEKHTVHADCTALDNSATILLVDDEVAVRKLAVRTLRSAGYTVIEAETGAEALAIMDAQGAVIDLLVTDLLMPNLGGRELVKRVRRGYPETRVLFMSGYADDATAEAAPLVQLLQKPFTPSRFLEAVQQALASSGTPTANRSISGDHRTGIT
jgi:two-component system cell cycle sensor histidine kinase/response regulator CckA